MGCMGWASGSLPPLYFPFFWGGPGHSDDPPWPSRARTPLSSTTRRSLSHSHMAQPLGSLLQGFTGAVGRPVQTGGPCPDAQAVLRLSHHRDRQAERCHRLSHRRLPTRPAHRERLTPPNGEATLQNHKGKLEASRPHPTRSLSTPAWYASTVVQLASRRTVRSLPFKRRGVTCMVHTPFSA